MTHLYLIRHGAYVSDRNEPIFDKGLTEVGIKQTEQLRDRLLTTNEIKPDLFISSTQPRAIQTAQILAPAFGMDFEQEADVEEWRNHSVATKDADWLAEIAAADVTQRNFYSPSPELESYTQFTIRACNALNQIVAANTGKTIVIVCHGGTVEASFHLFYGFTPFEQSPVTMLLNPDYTSITHWWRMGTIQHQYQWMLCEYNDKAHLS